MAVGGQASGNITVGGQSDWFKVQLAADTDYVISTVNGSLGSPLVTLYNSSGAYVISGNDGQTVAGNVTTFAPTTGGTYYVGVSDLQSGTGSFTVSVATLQPDVLGNIHTTGQVAVGGNASGTIAAVGQSEWYKIQLAADTEYVFDVAGGALMPAVSLYDSSGNLLTVSYNGGPNGAARASFEPTSSGTYYVGASGWLSTTGSFTVAVSTATPDHLGNIHTTDAVAVGSPVSGTITTTGQSDWFKISLAHGTEYVFDLGGGTLGGGTVTLYDASGNALVSGNGGGANGGARTSFEPIADGTYYVGASGSNGGTGTFTLAVSTATFDVPGNTTTNVAVAVGGQVSGTLATVGQSDWFKVQLTANTQYVLDVGSTSLASPQVSLYDGSGNLLVSGTGGTNADAVTSFTPTTSGTYYVAASELAVGDRGILAIGVDGGRRLCRQHLDNGEFRPPPLTASQEITTYSQGHLTLATPVLDSAASVQANLDGLQAIAAKGLLSTITFTDAATPTLTVTANQTALDQSALKAISGTYALSVTGYSAAVDLFAVQQNEHYAVGTNHPGMNSVIGFQSGTFSSGFDAVVLDGPRSQYLVQVDGTGHLVVDDTVSHQSITVTGDDYVVFNGASVSSSQVYDQAMFIASGPDVTLARIYQSTFGRLPDFQGFEAWRGVLDNGTLTINQVAVDFGTSGEFQARYGTNTTDQQYVDALYTNVLGRSADPGGEVAWVNYLTSLTQQQGQATARGAVLYDFAAAGEEAINSSSWLVDLGAGGYADSGVQLSATTVLTQVGTQNYLNTGLIDVSTIGTGVSTSAFQLAPGSAGASPTLTILPAAPGETVVLSAGITSVEVQNTGSTITAGTGNDTISIDGGVNTSVNLGNAGAHIVHVMGSVNTTINAFIPSTGSAVDVTNGATAANIAIVDGSQTPVAGNNLQFNQGTANVVNVGSFGDGSVTSVQAAINNAYIVADLPGENVTFMGTDNSGNTEFWFFGSTAGASHGQIPASSLAATADTNGNGTVDATEVTHIATLIGVTPANLTEFNLA